MSSRSSVQYVISATAPSGAAIGDEWYNSSTGALYQRTVISGQVGWAQVVPATAAAAGQMMVSQTSTLPTVWSNTISALTVAGLTTTQQTTDLLTSIAGATGTVIHNLALGGIFYHTGIAASFVANITNVPTTDSRTIMVMLVLTQGSTAYIPSALQIDGAAQTIKWLSSTVPTGNASKTDLIAFTLLRVSSTWTVLGSLSTYG